MCILVSEQYTNRLSRVPFACNFTMNQLKFLQFLEKIDDTLYHMILCQHLPQSNVKYVFYVTITSIGTHFHSGSTRCQYTIDFELTDDIGVRAPIRTSMTTDSINNVTVHSSTSMTCTLPSYDEIVANEVIATNNKGYSNMKLHIRPASRRRIFINAINEFGESGSVVGIWYEYRSTPRVYGVYPLRIFDDEEAEITVMGSNFILEETLQCRFVDITNSSLVTVSAMFVTSEYITCTLPVMQPKMVQIAVSNNGIDFVHFTEQWIDIMATPTISGLSPLKAYSVSTSYVTVIGSNFESIFAENSNGNLDANSVADSAGNYMEILCRFDGQYLVRNVTVLNDTHLNCPLVPLLATNSPSSSINVSVEVTFDGGMTFVNALENILEFEFIATHNMPRITSMYPLFTPRDTNTVVTIHGEAFSGGLYCKFGNVLSTATVMNDSMAFCDSGTLELDTFEYLDEAEEVTIVSVQISRFMDHDFCCDGIVQFRYIPILKLWYISPLMIFERTTLDVIEEGVYGNQSISTNHIGEMTEMISVFGLHFYQSPLLSCKFEYDGGVYMWCMSCKFALRVYIFKPFSH